MLQPESPYSNLKKIVLKKLKGQKGLFCENYNAHVLPNEVDVYWK